RAGPLLLVGDVGRRAGRDPAGARRQLDHIAASGAAEPHGGEVAVAVGDRLFRLQVLDEGDPFLQGLDDLLVVESVGRRLLQGAPVDDRDASPLPAELREVRLLAGRAGALSLPPRLGPVVEEAVEDLALLAVEDRPQTRLAASGPELLVARERLLREQGVVGRELGRR